jgi:flavodoxin
MKVRVVYHSQTGNTKKVAAAIAEARGCAAETAAECRITEPVDLLFIGAAVYATHDHDFPPAVKELIGRLDRKLVKKAVVFGTYSFENQAIQELARMVRKTGIPVADAHFKCKGRFLLSNLGRPNKDDLEQARAFARGF